MSSITSFKRAKVYNTMDASSRDVGTVLIFSIMTLVDTLNGIFELYLSSVAVRVGLLYRAVLVLFLIIKCNNRWSKKLTISLCVLLGGLLMSTLIHIILGNSLGIEFNMLFTWALFPVLVVLIMTIQKQGDFQNKQIERIIENYIWIVPMTIIIPKLLDLGRSTYYSGVGYKAFYHATNGISFFVGVLMVYSVCMLMEKASLKKVFQIILLLICAILIGTISSIGSIVISAVFGMLAIIRRSTKRFIRVLVLLMPMFLVAVFLVANHYSNELLDVYNRKVYFYGTYNNLFDFVTSGRTVILKDLIEKSDKNVISFLFGIGIEERICELDYFDYVLEYGLIGVLSICIFYFNTIRKIKEHDNVVKLLIWFSLMFAGIVGHVFTNTMSSTLFALLCMLDKEQTVYNKSIFKRS